MPNDQHFYICGDYNTNNEVTDFSLAIYTAAIVRMINDGTVKWYMTVAGTNPAITSTSTGIVNQDRCFGLTIDPKTEIVTALMQIKMGEVRTYYPGDFYDTLLLQFDGSGTIERSVTISNAELAYDMYSGQQSIFNLNGEVFFSGWAYGFKTRLQEYSLDSDSLNYDFYVYRYQWEHESSYNCIYEYVVPQSTMRDQVTYYSSTSFRANNMMTFFTKSSDVRKSRYDNYYKPYSSRYSGGFTLMDSMVIPRPCAYKSANLTQVDYYRG